MGRCQRRTSAPNSLEKSHQPGLVSTLVLAGFFARVLDFGLTLVSKANYPCPLTTEAPLHSPQSFQDALSSAMKRKGNHGHFISTISHKDVNARAAAFCFHFQGAAGVVSQKMSARVESAMHLSGNNRTQLELNSVLFSRY